MTRLVRGLWLAIVAAVLLRLFLLGWLPLIDPAEGRYGEIGRKMAELGDWVTPWHQYGVPFWGKPPLSFWMTAAGIEVLGVSEFAARLPHLVAGLATAGLVWNAARQRQPEVGAMAAAMLGTALLFFLSSGAVMTDAALVLGSTMAATGAWLAIAGEDADQRRRQAWLAVLGGAIGVLAKGPLALVVVGVPLLMWAAWCGRWRVLWGALPWGRGLALMGVLCLPWFIWAEARTPGFLEYFLVGEHYHRFMTPGWAGDLYGKAHHEPKGMIWGFAVMACLPWTLIVPALAAWRTWQDGRQPPPNAPRAPETGPWGITDREEGRFLLLWSLVPLGLFSASSNVIWTYALPAMPALAWWAARWMGTRPAQGLRWSLAGAWLAIVAWVVLAAAAQQMGRLERGSAKGLVAACHAAWQRHAPHALAGPPGLRGDQAEPQLVLLGRRSFSAHFYTHGRAIRVDSLAEVGQRWPRHGTCLAAKLDEPQALASVPFGVTVVEDLGIHHERRLWWVRARPTDGAPAGVAN